MLQNITDMHFLGSVLQMHFYARWTGPPRPLHLVLMYHPSWHLGIFLSLHTWEHLKVDEGPRLMLEAESDTSLV